MKINKRLTRLVLWEVILSINLDILALGVSGLQKNYFLLLTNNPLIILARFSAISLSLSDKHARTHARTHTHTHTHTLSLSNPWARTQSAQKSSRQAVVIDKWFHLESCVAHSNKIFYNNHLNHLHFPTIKTRFELSCCRKVGRTKCICTNNTS